MSSYLSECSEVGSYAVEPSVTELTTRWFVGDRRIKTDAASINQVRASIVWSEGPVYWDAEGRKAFSWSR